MVYYIHKKRNNKRGYTLSLNVHGVVSIVTGKHYSDSMVEEIVVKNMVWIAKARSKQKLFADLSKSAIADLGLTDENINEIKQNADDKIFARSLFWAKKMRLISKYKTCQIKNYKSKWGSCDNKGNITFNWRLALLGQEYIDYVIIHELSHLKYLDHSKSFWDYVSKWCSGVSELRKNINVKYLLLNEIV